MASTEYSPELGLSPGGVFMESDCDPDSLADGESRSGIGGEPQNEGPKRKRATSNGEVDVRRRSDALKNEIIVMNSREKQTRGEEQSVIN